MYLQTSCLSDCRVTVRLKQPWKIKCILDEFIKGPYVFVAGM